MSEEQRLRGEIEYLRGEMNAYKAEAQVCVEALVLALEANDDAIYALHMMIHDKEDYTGKRFADALAGVRQVMVIVTEALGVEECGDPDE